MTENKVVKPFQDLPTGKKVQVEQMFDDISHRYDFLNRFLSLGIDTRWRKKVIRLLQKEKVAHLLDVATGTGDLAIAAAKAKIPNVTAIDLSEGMLEKGREKTKALDLPQITFMKGDSENLPFEDNTFDAITVSFGVRNFENLDQGLLEMVRVLKPGKKLFVLEFSKPSGFPFKQIFAFYFRFILPFWGRLIARHSTAYTYLPDSVAAFPEGKDFTERLRRAGLKDTHYLRLTFGVCTLYSGIKS